MSNNSFGFITVNGGPNQNNWIRQFYAPGPGVIVQQVTVTGQSGSIFGGPSNQGNITYWEAFDVNSGGTAIPVMSQDVGMPGLPAAIVIGNDHFYASDDGLTAATYNFNASMTFYPGMSTQQLISAGLFFAPGTTGSAPNAGSNLAS